MRVKMSGPLLMQMGRTGTLNMGPTSLMTLRASEEVHYEKMDLIFITTEIINRAYFHNDSESI